MTEESIFAEAIEKTTPEDRAAYLDQACRGDAALRARVEGLLKAHDNPDRFLDDPVSNAAETIDHAPVTERAGADIGPYRLREQVGEGGMGVVFVAEQERPVRRKVALKIIKPGMDTKEVIARFEAERQALALMDHPNIAKVLDAGSTESGRPYFVMELVRGIPITEYCDQAKLTIRERLELFIQVCQAIQHAHQKGIIHRDVKPSNVLVTLHDGKPVPKVIDFGVAKATNQRLTERTIYTRFAQIIGTPMYMSPEQAELSGLDVDTRSDVYSLGVLLYELLTGTTPFDKARFEKAAYDEIRRIVREEEPPKPSTRISSLSDTATTVSSHRGTDPNGLCRSVRGDLDVIVMKAMEKDRTRRYDTASGLAADVQRFLCDAPIVARPSSFGYRFTKFACRNRATMLTSALVLVSLVGGIVASGISATLARGALAKARIILFDKAMWYALAGDVDHTRRAMEEAVDVGLPKSWQVFAEGVAHSWSGDQSDEARRCFSEASRLSGRSYAVLAASSQVVRTERELAETRMLLQSTQPSTPLDHLFCAQVETWIHPERAIRALDECGPWKRSTLAAHLGGLARINRSLELHDRRMLDAELDTFDDLLGWYPGNPVPLCAKLYAVLAAKQIAKYQDESDGTEEYDLAADDLAHRLEEPAKRIFWVARTRAWHFAERRNGIQAIEEWKKRMDREPFGIDAMHYAAFVQLFGNETDVAEAMVALPKRFGTENGYAWLARAYLLATTAAGPTDELIAACDAVVAHDNSPEMMCGAVEVNLASCDPTEARARAAAYLARLSPRTESHWRVILEYIAKEQSDVDFIKRFHAPMFQGMAEYYVGLRCLAQNDNERARRHFWTCGKSGRFLANWYWWSKVFLSRLERDH